MLQVGNYIDFNDSKLIIKRAIRLDQLKPSFDTNIMKQWSRSDTLLKKDGWLYCCEEIQEAIIFKPEDDIQLQLEFPEE
tara:strand:+ start:2865 stop:3101 length:237 start_codon:yes stop_codon:yes gene_type:complete